ncbi:hypothetical protein RYX36_030384 [Vicia faba]
MTMKDAMEEGSNNKWEWRKTRTTLMVELKKMSSIAGPMVATTVLQYLLQVVSVMMVGHLSQLSLSSVAIATSLTNVSGFSILSGMAGGLETLCGQAYGAGEFEKFGMYTHSAVISLTMVCAPITMIWIFMDKILILIGQDTTISYEARTYALWLIPALFASAILKPLTRFFQTQSLIFPMIISSFLVLCFHLITCWTLVFKLGLGHVGAAISFSLGTWLNVLILLCFAKYSYACEKTRVSFSTKAFLGIRDFFRLAVPSAAMVCLTISTLHFTISYGLGAATSTRVSNELGAGNPKAVRFSVWVARGSGWQHVGAYVNLGAFYLVGVPIGVVLGFVAHFRAKGLWIGIVAGSIVQTLFLFIITALTNWNKQKMSSIAGPMVATSVLQYLLQVVSVMMVGHLSQLSLSSVAIATSLTNVSGFSILSGMAGGMETLCGQAFGAEQFEKMGIYTYTAVISLAMVCAPITILWIFLDKILILIGQDTAISIEARTYALWLIPALFGSAILKPLTRFFQTQSIISPMIISSLIVLCFHGVTSWVLVFKLALGSVGTAIAFSLGTWLNVVILLCFVKYSSACEKTRVPFSKKVFVGFREFFALAVPSAAMVCLTISTLHFTIAYGLGAATRFVSLFTKLYGAAKGSGWQLVGAYVNLGAFYLVGIPVGAVLGFVVHFKAKGLWIGIVCGSIVQTICLSIITSRTDWKKQAKLARERVLDDALLRMDV